MIIFILVGAALGWLSGFSAIMSQIYKRNAKRKLKEPREIISDYYLTTSYYSDIY